MPISNEAKIYGYLISHIITGVSEIGDIFIKIEEKSKRNSYAFELQLNGRTLAKFAVYIKTSSKRISPWRFTFLKQHQEEILLLDDEYDEVFIALINGNDGVACFNYETLKVLLDDHFDDSEWVSVRRKAREQYTLAGKDGKMTGKLPLNDFPSAIVEFALKQLGQESGNTAMDLSSENNQKKRIFGLF